MPIGTVAAALLPPVINWLTGNANRKRQERQNQQDYTQELDKMNIQRQWALEDWTRETNYNTPAAQKQRLIDAELNPGLMYGQISSNLAADTRSGGIPSVNRTAPKMDNPNLSSGIALANDLKTSEENRENMKVQRDLLYANIRNADANTVKTMGDTEMTAAQRKQFEALAGDMITRVQLENRKIESETANIDATTLRTNVETDIAMDRNAREEIANSANVALTMQKIVTEKLEQKKREYEISTQPEQKQKLKLEVEQLEYLTQIAYDEHKMKQVEQKIYTKLGITKNDPYYVRALVKEMMEN